MSTASMNIETELSARGYRITRVRRELCTALQNAKAPLTIRDLARTVSADEASVYRFVRTLLTEDLAEEIVARGEKPRYAVKGDHHHHVVCTGCGFTEHVPCAYTPRVPKTLAGFATVADHDLTFYGRCLSCK